MLYEVITENEEGVEKVLSGKDKKRVDKVVTSFKALEKAKKEWMKVVEKADPAFFEEGEPTEDQVFYFMTLTFKKLALREKLLDLGPTSKLINELVRSMA